MLYQLCSDLKASDITELQWSPKEERVPVQLTSEFAKKHPNFGIRTKLKNTRPPAYSVFINYDSFQAYAEITLAKDPDVSEVRMLLDIQSDKADSY